MLKKQWRTARLLAIWHGGKPSQYLPELLKQGDGFQWYDVSGVKLCLFLLAVDVQLAYEAARVLF